MASRGSRIRARGGLWLLGIGLLACVCGCSGPLAWPTAWKDAAGRLTGDGDAFTTDHKVSSLRGRVFFPGRRLQASIADIAVAATVSLIDPVRNETRATTVTDDQGSFSLDLLGFLPAAQPYYLEAVKGLPSGPISNAVGKDAARVRTLVRFQGGSWASLTPGSIIVISRATTALSAIVSLRQSTSPVNPELLMGTLSTSGGSAIFRDEGTGIGQTEFATVLDLVSRALVADHDPLEGLIYGGGSYDLKPGIVQEVRPFIHKVDPSVASIGQRLVIRGTGFGEARDQVDVRFAPGISAALATASATELWVTVPPGAQTGEIQVTVAGKTTSSPFTLLPELAGGFNP